MNWIEIKDIVFLLQNSLFKNNLKLSYVILITFTRHSLLLYFQQAEEPLFW